MFIALASHLTGGLCLRGASSGPATTSLKTTGPLHCIPLLLALGLVAPSDVAAATVFPAANCSPAAVQAAINMASDGDMVVIPPGTCLWTSGVTIRNKGIRLLGGGSGRIIARSASIVTVGSGSKEFEIQSGLAITAGQILRVSQLGTRSNFMEGAVISYSGTTLRINATNTGGSGTPKVWIVSTSPTTVIVNNGSGALIDVEEDDTHPVEIGGIKMADGSGSGRRIEIRLRPLGALGRPVLLHDCWLEAGTGGDLIWTESNRGVIWNCSFDSSPFSLAQLAIHHQPDHISDSWTTPSTMGSADTTGESNLYIEDSDFHAFIHATDFDDNARAVMRHVVFNNAAIGTHGADTSLWGLRHFEVYDSEFVFNGFSDLTTFSLNHWFFIRGGTFVVTNNVIPDINSQDYGDKLEFEITVMNLQRNAGPNPCWGAGMPGIQYPAPRQPGFGYVTGTGLDGLGRSTDFDAPRQILGTYVGDIEPMYIWNNTTNGVLNGAIRVDTSDYGECSDADATADYVQSGRDYFLNAGAKPGYMPFTYPHPLRTGGPAPSAPSNLRILP